MDVHLSDIGILCDLGSENFLQPPKKCTWCAIISPFYNIFIILIKKLITCAKIFTGWEFYTHQISREEWELNSHDPWLWPYKRVLNHSATADNTFLYLIDDVLKKLINYMMNSTCIFTISYTSSQSHLNTY